MFLFPLLVLASTSTNFQMNKEHGGPVDFDGSSSNYQFKAEVGHPGVWKSTSTHYEFWHGTFWEDSGEPKVTIKWAVPEKRVGATSTNDDAIFYLTVRTSDDSDDVVLYTMPDLATTTIAGIYATSITMTGITDGVYDVGIKTHQHLTKLIQNVTLSSATTTVLNFTNTTNTTVYGSGVLLAGDISGTTSTPADLGDDVVNSVDLSIIINDLDKDDLTGNDIRSNLNEDVVVNSVDLSLMLKNLDVEGEK